MKKFAFVSIMVAAVFTTLAAGENLLYPQKWSIRNKKDAKSTQIIEKNVMKFHNFNSCDMSYRQGMAFKEPRPTKLKASCEVWGKDVKGGHPGKFSLYMDICFVDNTWAFGQAVGCPNGSYDWKKVSKVFNYQKPIKWVNFYVLFRGVTGEAQFRNVTLEVVK